VPFAFSNDSTKPAISFRQFSTACAYAANAASPMVTGFCELKVASPVDLDSTTYGSEAWFSLLLASVGVLNEGSSTA